MSSGGRGHFENEDFRGRSMKSGVSSQGSRGGLQGSRGGSSAGVGNFERRQNKLPPRLAKQKEQSRLALQQKNNWNENDNDWKAEVDNLSEMLEKNKTESQAEKEDDEAEKATDAVQTIIFENTHFKGGNKNTEISEHFMGFGKQEDSADLKLDFTTFGESSDLVANDDVESSSKVHPTTDDLNLRMQSVKKIWENNGDAAEDSSKVSSTEPTNVAKVRPTQSSSSQQPQNPQPNSAQIAPSTNQQTTPQPIQIPQQPPQQIPQAPHDFDRTNRFAPPRSLLSGNNSGNSGIALHSPLSQPLYQTFQLDGRPAGMTNQLYSAYAGQPNILPHADMFPGAASSNPFCLPFPPPHPPPHHPQSSSSSPNSLSLTSGMKNQIGPIGTKANSGNSFAPQQLIHQYDGNPLNYMNQLQRTSSGSGTTGSISGSVTGSSTQQQQQTQFYHSLATSNAQQQQQSGRQQFGLQGFPTGNYAICMHGVY